MNFRRRKGKGTFFYDLFDNRTFVQNFTDRIFGKEAPDSMNTPSDLKACLKLSKMEKN